MQFSEHERARHLADKALVEGISLDEQQWLDDHTKNCVDCAEHVQLSAKIVRGFNAFSFEMEPGTNVRVQDAVARRAMEGTDAVTLEETTVAGSLLKDRSAEVSDVTTRKISVFPVRRIVFVGATIAAAALLVIGVMKFESPRTAPADAQHQSAQAPQLAASLNQSSPAVTTDLSVSTHDAPVVAHIKPRRAPKPLVAETEFIPLDDGPPVIDGTIVRINMPDTFAVHPRRGHKGNTVPAEVLVDEAGLVRAIRFLDEDSR